MIFTLAFGMLIAIGVNAQEVKKEKGECCAIEVQNEKGDWYVGAGDISNTPWTGWSLSPTIGYAPIDNLMVGMNLSQADSTEDLGVGLHARYFWKGYFAYAATEGLSVRDTKLGVGRMFTFRRGGVYLDPRVVYNTTKKTTNLELGLGLKF